MLRKMSKNQSGFILIYVTLTLAIAMIILPALLLFIGGAGRTAQMREDRMLQVYAADAGIEKAFHEIVINQPQPTPADPNGLAWVGNITGNVTGTIYGFNDNFVDIEVYKVGNETGEYRILSTATNWEGINTTIECYTAVQDSWSLFDNALTQRDYNGIIELKQHVNIIGDIAMNGDYKGQGWGWDDNLDKVRDEPVVYWPNAETLIQYYQDEVGTCIDPLPGVTMYPGANIDVAGSRTEGPLLVCGDLEFYSSVDDSSVLTLGGTIYVTGDFTIRPNSKEFTLDLNGHTIFCEQEITISTACDIIGSGCIVALGDIDFGPKSGTQEGEFVFVLSVNGALTIWPTGDFFGSFAGYTDIIVRQGIEASITWVDYSTIGDGFWEPNFPTEDDVMLPAIITYTILD